jgi:hypothetical protein
MGKGKGMRVVEPLLLELVLRRLPMRQDLMVGGMDVRPKEEVLMRGVVELKIEEEGVEVEWGRGREIAVNVGLEFPGSLIAPFLSALSPVEI